MSFDFISLGEVPLKKIGDVDISSLQELPPHLKIHSKVVLITMDKTSLDFLAKSENTLFKTCIFIYIKISSTNLNAWHAVFNNFKPQSVIEESNLTTDFLFHSIKTLRAIEQNQSLHQMKWEQAKETLALRENQAHKLEDQKTKLLRSQRQLSQIKEMEHLNFKCLEAVFESQTLADIEEQITGILSETLELRWLRILLSPAEILIELPIIKFQKIYKISHYEIDVGKKITGKIIFAYDKNFSLKKTYENLLQKICDAISLRVKQIVTENDIEASQRQWEATFQALPFKAALIGKDYRIIQVGGKFNSTDLYNSEFCYKKFFDRNRPCPGCKLGESFLIEQNNESIEVNSKEIFNAFTDDHYFLNFYRDFDVTTIHESGKAFNTKLEELGMITGSIAHELNNPLGGIKILLDLLETDSQIQSSQDKEDLGLLKLSNEKCIQTVRELLNFTRHKEKPNHIETLGKSLEKLQIFTQAYMLSKGYRLHILPSPYLNLNISSNSPILLIKLLEGASHYTHLLRKQNLVRSDVYIFSYLQSESLRPNSSSELLIGFTHSMEKAPQFKGKKQVLPQHPITLNAHPSLDSESSHQVLTLKFPTEVKPNETHV